MRKPPKIIPWILRRLLKPDLYAGIYGDLLEEYHAKETTKWKADLWFLFSGLGFFRFPVLFNSTNHQRNPIMNTWKNHFIVSFRSLKRSKLSTLISVLGLVVSFTSSLAILQYVRFEKSYDSFLDKKVYRATHSMTSSAVVTQNATTFFGAKEDFKQQIPGIANTAHFLPIGQALIRIDERPIRQQSILCASPDLFEVMGYKVLEGRVFEKENVNGIAISASVAERWFPNGDALGKTVEVEGLFGSDWNPEIVMIYEDLPDNSHLLSEMVIPMQKLVDISQEQNFFGPNYTFEQVRWLWLSFHTYLELEPGTDPDQVQKEANEIIATNRRDRNALLNQHHEIRLQPISTIHTTAGIENEMKPVNDLQIINLFGIVAICILIIGWINYINLSTAKSVNRGREVGIRKVLGSSLIQLKTQFQVEAFLINFFAFILALGLLVVVAPMLEQVTQVPFFKTFFTDTFWIAGAVVALVAGSLLSGFYPAQVLSGFKSIEILKGKFKSSGKGVALRRVLVGVQFSFTLFLMSGLMIVHHQMNYMLDHDLGIDIGQTIIINAAPEAAATTEYTGKMTALRNQMSQMAGIDQVAIGSMAPGLINGWRISTEDSRSERSGVFLQRSLVDHDYFKLYGVELVAGRLFEKEYGTESTNAVLNINATQRLGFDEPEEAIGYDLSFGGEHFEVVGVVNDFYQRGVQFALEPMVFNLDTALVGNFIAIKSDSELAKVLPEAERIYRETFPRAPFESRVVENVYRAQYENEQRFRTLFSMFTGIASIVAVLGLLGLATFLLNQRLKEICVRKVLGAQSSGLFLILNKEYLIINSISFLIAIPVTLYFMKGWLDGFENRISLNALYFVVPLAATLVIVLASTLSQTMKVIKTNPAEILKEDD